jgi:hypothetical protein
MGRDHWYLRVSDLVKRLPSDDNFRKFHARKDGDAGVRAKYEKWGVGSRNPDSKRVSGGSNYERLSAVRKEGSAPGVR